jgi:hypothetical protein
MQNSNILSTPSRDLGMSKCENFLSLSQGRSIFFLQISMLETYWKIDIDSVVWRNTAIVFKWK